MNTYVTGTFIKERRMEKGITQLQLANKLMVSEKTISKWETGRGLPDISLLESLSKALDISLVELFQGDKIVNQNKSANLLKTNFYVCPICHNIVMSIGEGVFSCCGNALLKQVSEEAQIIKINLSDEIEIEIDSPMTKNDYISFVAYVTGDKIDLHKLYPEQNAYTTFLKRGHGIIYYYDIKNGLFGKRI